MASDNRGSASALVLGLLGIAMFGVLMTLRKKFASDLYAAVCAAAAALSCLFGIRSLMRYARKNDQSSS